MERNALPFPKLARRTIEEQRKFHEATIQTQERERTEICKELQENINQILTTTRIYIDMALDEADIREELLHRSYMNISRAIEQISTLSRSLVPSSLGDIGLKEALKELIGNLAITCPVRIRLRTGALHKIAIPDAIQLMVYRIIQEQLNNIVKHSKATKAEIQLSVSKKMLNINISDNGIGFNPLKKRKGFGLNSIISRAELYHGKVNIISVPGNGSSLIIEIPIKI